MNTKFVHLKPISHSSYFPIVQRRSSPRLKTNLKASWAPVHKLNGSLGLDCCNSCIHILGYHITTEQQATGHVFAVTWVTFNHLIGWFKASVGDFRNTQLLVISFLSRDNGSIGGQREVNAWVWHQVGLESKYNKDVFKSSMKPKQKATREPFGYIPKDTGELKLKETLRIGESLFTSLA